MDLLIYLWTFVYHTVAIHLMASVYCRFVMHLMSDVYHGLVIQLMALVALVYHGPVERPIGLHVSHDRDAHNALRGSRACNTPNDFNVSRAR